MKLNLFFCYALLYTVFVFGQDAYTAAESGLFVREEPNTNGVILEKLNFAEPVEILERTSARLSIKDGDLEIPGSWCKIKSIQRPEIVGYVFSGYLSPDRIVRNQSIRLNNYQVNISKSSKKEFLKFTNKEKPHKVKSRKICEAEGLVQIISNEKIIFKLDNNQSKILQKDPDDLLFHSYSLMHYDPLINQYFVYVSSHEGGGSLMVDGKNGAIYDVNSDQYKLNPANNTNAIYADDIGSGWTPNGLQIMDLNTANPTTLFNLDPTMHLETYWGIVDVAWKNNNTVIVAAIVHNLGGGYCIMHKAISWEKK